MLMWNDILRKILLEHGEVQLSTNYEKDNLVIQIILIIIQIISMIATIVLAYYSYKISKEANHLTKRNNEYNETIQRENRLKYIGDSIKEIIEIIPSIYTLNTIYSNVNGAYFEKLPEKENIISIVSDPQQFFYILNENKKNIKTISNEYLSLLEVATVKIMHERGLLTPPKAGKTYIPNAIAISAYEHINKGHLNQAKVFLHNERCKVLNTLELLAFKYWQIEDPQSSIDQEIGDIVIELLSNMFIEVAKKSWKEELPQLWMYFVSLTKSDSMKPKDEISKKLFDIKS